jgi:hypothetical protein
MCIRTRNEEIQMRLSVPEHNIDKMFDNVAWALIEFNLLKKTKNNRKLTTNSYQALEETIPVIGSYLTNAKLAAKDITEEEKRKALFLRHYQLHLTFLETKEKFENKKKRKEKREKKKKEKKLQKLKNETI